MRIKACFMLLTLCFGLNLILAFTGQSLSATIRVPGDQPTIQAGIDAAENGDTVLVADGTYTGAGNKDLDFRGMNITVTSENGANSTIIDCEGTGRGFYFHSGETEASVVSGFTIRNGFADRGGGIYCQNSSPTIQNNIIEENSASYGGGIYCDKSFPMILSNTIEANSASNRGGGIYCNYSSPIILYNLIKDNDSSDDGGGIYYYSSPTTSRLVILNNIIEGNTAIDSGGGMYFFSCVITSSAPIILNSVIVGNSAANGGGIYCNSSYLTIVNNTITENFASSFAGGISCWSLSHPTVLNTILWSDSHNEIYIDPYSKITITYSDIQGGWDGNGNIDVDPFFVNAASGDYHLRDDSPCIGAGIMTSDVPDTDIDGNPRPNPPGSNPDMGAYENPLGTPIELKPPTVTGVTPSSRGQGATAQDIVVTGANFMNGAIVSFSGVGITVNSTTFISSTELIANIDIASDAPVSVRDVIVTNPDGQMGTGEDMFEVNAAPIVISTNPSSLSQGSENQDVMIEGSGFVDNLSDAPNGPQLAADFGDGITVNYTIFVSSIQLLANISIADDAAVGKRDVTVINGDAGVGIGVSIFTVSEQFPPPIIERISPEIGQISGGDRVVIWGNYFQDGTTVTIGGNPATEVTVDSKTQITVKTPPGELGITDVVVFNPDGQSSTLSRGFAYIPVYGDVSNDGTVSAYDAALILRFVVGLIDTFPVSITQSPEQITPRNYTISLPSMSAQVGKRIRVPIAINNATGLLAGGIILKYDPTVLKVVGFAAPSLLNGFYWKANSNLESEVRFAFATTEMTKGQGNLLMVEFEVLPNTEGKISSLILDNITLSNSLTITKINGSVTVIPSTFALFQNYPNPFNPESWIPYNLAKDSTVTISIYNAKGKHIRTIALGDKNAGVYMTKDKAAYWDGRDSLGQKVASGVYFYTLQADEFRATRKMVVLK